MRSLGPIVFAIATESTTATTAAWPTRTRTSTTRRTTSSWRTTGSRTSTGSTARSTTGAAATGTTLRWSRLIGGRFRDGRTPPDARLLVETVSPALPEVLRDMNKWSNNVIAREVLATLGAVSEPGEDSVAAGARAAQRSLASNGIPTAGLVIENGAGLSRNERITAATLGQMLQSAWRSRTMPELISSLPVAGIDGTARKRLAGSAAAGSAHVKTGTLDGVRSIAGYVLANSGRRYVVVLMINHPNASAARAVQDALMEWVAGL